MSFGPASAKTAREPRQQRSAIVRGGSHFVL